MGFKMMKVFECHEMPDDVRKYFFEHSEQGNDCYVSYWTEPNEVLEEDGTEVWNPVATWLKENGAEEGEQVLISHWW